MEDAIILFSILVTLSVGFYFVKKQSDKTREQMMKEMQELDEELKESFNEKDND